MSRLDFNLLITFDVLLAEGNKATSRARPAIRSPRHFTSGD